MIDNLTKRIKSWLSNEGKPVKRIHSIFGDYLTGDPKQMPPNEFKKLQEDIALFNSLWTKYLDSIKGEWGIGSIPTDKGFTEWLQKQMNSKEDK